MAADWSALPGDIVNAISKVLNSDLDILRLRSVCSSWQSFVALPRKRFSFPLKVPSILDRSDRDLNGYFVINQNTVYRLSPPEHGSCPNSSDGWLFKVRETTNANTFSLLHPLSSDKINSPPGMILNLLNHRISEICKSYTLGFVDLEKTSDHSQSLVLRKVCALWNYVDDCEFVVLSLHHAAFLEYWKFGDDKWTKIDTYGKGIWFQDVIIYDGKVYAIDVRGLIVFLDSKLNVTVVSSPSFSSVYQHNYLVECKSDLYTMTKVPGPFSPEHDFSSDNSEDPFICRLNKLKLDMSRNARWDRVVNLGDSVLFFCNDKSFSVSAKDFGGFKGNCVFLTDPCFIDVDEGTSSVYGDDTGVYDLDAQSIKGLAVAQDYAKLFWPPPSWLMPIASSSSQ